VDLVFDPGHVRGTLCGFSEPGQTVLDPMAGSGTTVVEGCLHGRVARGVNIDPLARLIAKVEATTVDVDAFGKALSPTSCAWPGEAASMRTGDQHCPAGNAGSALMWHVTWPGSGQQSSHWVRIRM
jgi:Putative RNA methylase family UPF0020